jgi:hypothetical protein
MLTSRIVIVRNRRGVNHEKCRTAIYARVPKTPAPAVIAVATHCMRTPAA